MEYTRFTWRLTNSANASSTPFVVYSRSNSMSARGSSYLYHGRSCQNPTEIPKNVATTQIALHDIYNSLTDSVSKTRQMCPMQIFCFIPLESRTSWPPTGVALQGGDGYVLESTKYEWRTQRGLAAACSKTWL